MNIATGNKVHVTLDDGTQICGIATLWRDIQPYFEDGFDIGPLEFEKIGSKHCALLVSDGAAYDSEHKPFYGTIDYVDTRA